MSAPDELLRTLDDLVAEHGLPAVHATLRAIGDYCGNCGCPKVEGERHVYFSMGGCSIDGPLPTQPPGA